MYYVNIPYITHTLKIVLYIPIIQRNTRQNYYCFQRHFLWPHFIFYFFFRVYLNILCVEKLNFIFKTSNSYIYIIICSIPPTTVACRHIFFYSCTYIKHSTREKLALLLYTFLARAQCNTGLPYNLILLYRAPGCLRILFSIKLIN